MRVILTFITLLLVSCSTVKTGTKRNHKITKKLVASLFEEKGNVFYLTSTYATFSRIWTYSKEKIEIYRLANGKVYKQEEFDKTESALSKVNSFSRESIFELDSCMELDGDGLGFKIKVANQITEEELPIEINCLKKSKYKSDFLNTLVDDINTYELWEVETKTY